MKKITTCKLQLEGDYINWETDLIKIVGEFVTVRSEIIEYKELCKPTELKNELFRGKKNIEDAVKFCQQLRSSMPVIRNKQDYSIKTLFNIVH